MSVRPIVLYPHPTLNTPAVPVADFGPALHTLLDDLAETMYVAEGIGLAANQIDVLQRACVIDIGTDETGAQLLELVNPEVVEREGELVWNEGCLSIPGIYWDVVRAQRVAVRYFDREGAEQRIEADGLLGVALQHEIDHLDGVVFFDRLNDADRRMALRAWRRKHPEHRRG